MNVIKITSKGREVLLEEVKRRQMEFEKMFQNFKEPELEHLLIGLKKMIESVEKSAGHFS